MNIFSSYIDNIPDIAGWIGNIFFLWGICMIGNKNIKGFYANILGNFMYIIQSLMLVIPSLFVLSSLLILLNIKAIFCWKKKDIRKNHV